MTHWRLRFHHGPKNQTDDPDTADDTDNDGPAPSLVQLDSNNGDAVPRLGLMYPNVPVLYGFCYNDTHPANQNREIKCHAKKNKPSDCPMDNRRHLCGEKLTSPGT